MKYVVDASVALKWFRGGEPDEENVEEAVELLLAIQTGEVEVIQPPHWKAEVLSVLARQYPEDIDTMAGAVEALGFTAIDTLEIYQRAGRLANKLNHHLFDTLYHAVALETGAEFVTADRKYARKARGEGALKLLG